MNLTRILNRLEILTRQMNEKTEQFSSLFYPTVFCQSFAKFKFQTCTIDIVFNFLNVKF